MAKPYFNVCSSYNAVHGSDAPDTAAYELDFFFSNPSLGKCDLGRGTTLGIIKPHAVLDGAAGLTLDIVSEHFNITALRLCTLDKAAAAEFYEVYKGVLAIGEFTSLVDELTSGPCIAFEVADRDGGGSAESAVESFRELCGPMDPELARVLRPKSVRAQFGLNKIKNGIHCTDLAEDGQLEVRRDCKSQDYRCMLQMEWCHDLQPIPTFAYRWSTFFPSCYKRASSCKLSELICFLVRPPYSVWVPI